MLSHAVAARKHLTRRATLTALLDVVDSGTVRDLSHGPESRERGAPRQQTMLSVSVIVPTLNEEEKDIFFVLKAKCPVIAGDLGCHVGSLVLRRSTHARTTPFEIDDIEDVDPVGVEKE